MGREFFTVQKEMEMILEKFLFEEEHFGRRYRQKRAGKIRRIALLVAVLNQQLAKRYERSKPFSFVVKKTLFGEMDINDFIELKRFFKEAGWKFKLLVDKQSNWVIELS